MTAGDLATVAAVVADAVGGTVFEVPGAELPTASVVVGERHLVLVRRHPRTWSLSLPGGPAWDCPGGADDVRRLGPELAATVAAAPAGVSIMDVVATVLSDFAVWRLRHPGTAVPSEAWLHEPDGDGSIGLFQDGAAVRVVVWQGDRAAEKRLRSRRGFERLDRWLYEALGHQRRDIEAARARQAARDALPVPTVAEVLARLRSGERIQTGGGRAWSAYRVDGGGQLRHFAFDEGDEQEGPATEADLAAAIAAHPDAFKPR